MVGRVLQTLDHPSRATETPGDGTDQDCDSNDGTRERGNSATQPQSRQDAMQRLFENVAMRVGSGTPTHTGVPLARPEGLEPPTF
jgi:hypothetical protein